MICTTSPSRPGNWALEGQRAGFARLTSPCAAPGPISWRFSWNEERYRRCCLGCVFFLSYIFSSQRIFSRGYGDMDHFMEIFISGMVGVMVGMLVGAWICWQVRY